eukprot:237733-Chlamydomonas_euryale.AAC.8
MHGLGGMHGHAWAGGHARPCMGSGACMAMHGLASIGECCAAKYITPWRNLRQERVEAGGPRRLCIVTPKQLLFEATSAAAGAGAARRGRRGCGRPCRQQRHEQERIGRTALTGAGVRTGALQPRPPRCGHPPTRPQRGRSHGPRRLARVRRGDCAGLRRAAGPFTPPVRMRLSTRRVRISRSSVGMFAPWPDVCPHHTSQVCRLKRARRAERWGVVARNPEGAPAVNPTCATVGAVALQLLADSDRSCRVWAGAARSVETRDELFFVLSSVPACMSSCMHVSPPSMQCQTQCRSSMQG